MRSLVVFFISLSAAASAQTAISGTFSGKFEGFNEFGVPKTRLTLALQCSLTCPPSAPTLKFQVVGTTTGYFVSDPSKTVGFVGTGFGSDPSGLTDIVSEQFPAGTAFFVRAKSATCHCGNANGQGGFVDLETAPVRIPAWASFGSSTVKTGFEYALSVSARPQGAEQVEVKLTGAGLDQTTVLGPTDFSSGGSGLVRYKATAPGTLTATTKLLPSGVTFTVTKEVVAGTSGAGGGGGGGGSSGAGGGGGDATMEPAPMGCQSSPGFPIMALGLALAVTFGRRSMQPRKRREHSGQER